MPIMPGSRESALWHLLARSTGNRPETYLVNSRLDGLSFQAIARQIQRDFGFTVSHEWVRQQCIRIGVRWRNTSDDAA